jgi:hypothetical protein
MLILREVQVKYIGKSNRRKSFAMREVEDDKRDSC